MKTFDNENESVLVQPDRKHTSTRIIVGAISILFFAAISFVIGRITTPTCNPSVLGIQSSESIGTRLAMIFNLERGGSSLQFQQAPVLSTPTPEPTVEPTPEPTDKPGMIWSGTGRNPTPEPTWMPNNVITTPVPAATPNNVITTPDKNPTPEPTPKYKTNFGRNEPTPTPAIKPENIEAVPLESLDASAGAIVSKTPAINIVPTAVQTLIENAGLQIGKLQVSRTEGEKGVRVSGALHEKIFGLIPISYPIAIQVDEDSGEINSTSVPWWRSLFGNPLIGKVEIAPKNPSPTPVTDDSETITQNEITLTISPTHGPAGTKINVHVDGIVPNNRAPYATIVLLAANGIGKDADTSTYTFNTTKIVNGTYETTYVIPATVMTSEPGGQNYSKEVPIEIGDGNITFSYQHPLLHDISIKAPFSVESN